MRSATPKVLHPLCGRPMLLHVLDALAQLPLERIVVVVGHGAEHVTKTLQEQLAPVTSRSSSSSSSVQRGTGDAVSVALTAFAYDLDVEDDLIVVAGDVPLLRAETLAQLATEHRRADAAATLLTARVADPTGYGRIVRDEQGRVDRIVEQADADADELEIDEVNPSIYCFRRGLLAPALRRLSPENAQGEYYLTDVVGGAAPGRARRARASRPRTPPTRSASTTAPSSPRPKPSCGARINDRWMREGVGMTDPARTYVDTTVELAPDVRLLPGHDARGPHRRRSRARSSAPTPSSSTPSSARARSSARPSPASRRSATARPSARTCRCGPAPASPPARTSARSSR